MPFPSPMVFTFQCCSNIFLLQYYQPFEVMSAIRSDEFEVSYVNFYKKIYKISMFPIPSIYNANFEATKKCWLFSLMLAPQLSYLKTA